MATIEYGPWMPDQPRLNNTCITAQNVYPIATGYAPFPSASSISDALGAACIGVICFKQTDGTIETFAGTATQLFRLSGTSWTDVSKAGNYTSSSEWRFAVYGGRLIATNNTDNPQKFDLASDTKFSDLSNAPIHAFPIVIRDVLVALGVNDGSIFQIKFSAVNDSEKWTADCGGGAQQVPDGGPVVGGVGGEFGIILQENAITRMNFVGGDLRFTFDKVEGALGCTHADSIVQYKGLIFYLSDEGFQVFTGTSSENISDNAVSDHFFGLQTTGRVYGALDPANSSVVWSYPISGGRQQILYNYRVKRWAESTAAETCLHTGITSSGEVLRGFDSNNDLASYTGADLSAKVSTGDLQLAKGRRAMVSVVRGLVDAAHDITVGKKTDLADSEATETGSSNSNGKVSVRANARYHRFQVVPTAAFTELTGVEIEAAPSGKR